MPRTQVIFLSLVLVCLCLSKGWSDESLPPGVVCLLEDNGADLLGQLTNPSGDLGEGEEDQAVKFSGRSSIKITNYQRYFNLIPGWAYRIVEKPKEQEYRFLRLAWKSDGLSGIMLQLHDDKDWHIRYCAGANKFGWAAKQIGEAPPSEWTVVTLDLFKDFGEREIHGIALTAFDGKAGYFDHIYLARSIEELDRIDATGLDRSKLSEISPDELREHVHQVDSGDASVAYRSFWTLAAGGPVAKAAVEKELGEDEDAEVDAATIDKWIAELDDDLFSVREQAGAKLANHIGLSRSRLEEELKSTTSIEVQTRIESILRSEGATDQSRVREQRLRRLIRVIDERGARMAR